jgi:hypothetical protein
MNVLIIKPIRPLIDGFLLPDDIIMLPLVGKSCLSGAWFSKSGRTCYACENEENMDVFRLKNGHWFCWGSGSKQKWLLIKKEIKS